MNTRWFFLIVIAFGALMISLWLGENIHAFYPVKQRVIVLRAPLGTNGWTGPYFVDDRTWTPLYKNASATLQEQYFSETDKSSIYLYSAYFDSDKELSDMLAYSNVMYDPKLWKQIRSGGVEVKLSDNQTITVFEEALESNSVFRVVWYWYYVAGVSTTDLTLAKILDKVRIVAKYAQGSGVGVISVSTTYLIDPTEATQRLKSFLSVMYNGLDVLKRPEIFYTLPNQAGT